MSFEQAFFIYDDFFDSKSMSFRFLMNDSSINISKLLNKFATLIASDFANWKRFEVQLHVLFYKRFKVHNQTRKRIFFFFWIDESCHKYNF